jgi:hypothetical protein
MGSAEIGKLDREAIGRIIAAVIRVICCSYPMRKHGRVGAQFFSCLAVRVKMTQQGQRLDSALVEADWLWVNDSNR